MSMNVHHLELFYFVARFGGISEAVRNIPYGIQQPAVSSQVLQLEEFLGVTLFNRRPFALTAAGEKLYQFIQPFFSGLDQIADELQGGISQLVRFGASEVVLRDHLPELIQRVREKFPKMRLSLREGYQPQLESWLQKQEIDLAVTLLQKKPPSGINSIPLLPLHLALLVPKSSRLQAAEELWKRDRIEDTLISLPPTEALCKNFQQSLTRMGIDWFPKIEVSSVALIEAYVANGYGIGLSVAVPKAKPPPNLRLIPLPNFEPVMVGVLWQGKLSPLMQTFLDEIQKHVKSLGGTK